MPDSEKRRFKRFNKDYTIHYVTEEHPKIKYDISKIKNISEGGILFTTSKPFKKGNIVSLKIRLPQAGDYVIFKVQVIDSVEIGKDMLYNIRAMFLNIDEGTKEMLRKISE
jgi:hypothetical protein